MRILILITDGLTDYKVNGLMRYKGCYADSSKLIVHAVDIRIVRILGVGLHFNLRWPMNTFRNKMNKPYIGTHGNIASL